MDAFELYNEKQKPTGIWCCGKCRKLVLSPLFDFRGETPKSTQEAAEACCRPRLCDQCQAEIPNTRYRTESLCDACESTKQALARVERYDRQIAKAVLTRPVDYIGPVYSEDGPGGDWGDGYYSDLNYLVEAIGDSDNIFDDEGRLVVDNIPEFAFCCADEVKAIDLDHVLENLCSDGYEGMDDRIDVPDSLKAGIAEFNKLNEKTLTVYNTDYSRKLPLRAAVLEYMGMHITETGEVELNAAVTPE